MSAFADFSTYLAAKDLLGLARLFAQDALDSARENGATPDREVGDAVSLVDGVRNLAERDAHGYNLWNSLTDGEMEEVSRLTVAVLEGRPLRALDPEVRALLEEVLRVLPAEKTTAPLARKIRAALSV